METNMALSGRVGNNFPLAYEPIPVATNIEKSIAVNAKIGVPRINRNFWIKVISLLIAYQCPLS